MNKSKDPFASPLGTFAVGAALTTVLIFLWILGDILLKGAHQIDWSFLTENSSNAGRSGGIAGILVSTFWLLVICMTATVPIGLGAAIFLSEINGLGSRPMLAIFRRSLDILAGVPSIVFGLFGNAFFCNILGLGYSLLSGGLTLACMVLPFFIRATEEALRSIPIKTKWGAHALGFSKADAFSYIFFPAALPGIIVGLVLSVGRALAETSALLFTSGYIDRMPGSMWDSGRAISVHIYDLTMNVGGGDANAYRTAFVLVSLLLMINISTNTLGHWWFRRHISP